tara:strand:+ start:2755 stop:3228 length:474 start_codon:yes stop_codon:yes gene_type:complete
MSTPFKMKGSPMARNFGAPFKDKNKTSYTKKDPDKSYMKKGESEFGLYKGKELDPEKLNATTGTAIGAGGIFANSAAHSSMGGVNLAGRAVSSGSMPLTAALGTGIVAAEGVRRVKAGKTNAKERKATKFSNNKTWSEAKKTKTPKKNQKINFNKGK